MHIIELKHAEVHLAQLIREAADGENIVITSGGKPLAVLETCAGGILSEGDEIFTAEQLAELDRRLDEIEAGKVDFEPWESIRDRLLSKR